MRSPALGLPRCVLGRRRSAFKPQTECRHRAECTHHLRRRRIHFRL